MLDLGNDPSRQLALQLCRREGLTSDFGILFLENVARILFHCLGPGGVKHYLGKNLSLSEVLRGSHPWSRQRWKEKLQRELSQPYGDEQVFVRLETFEACLGQVLCLADAAWICGSFAKGHFSPHSDLDVAVRVADPARRLRALGGQFEPVSLFVLPLDPRLEKVELVLSGALVPLPLTRPLHLEYWEVLRTRGYDISPFPRVVGPPTQRPRVREVPFWLENHFKQSHPSRQRGFFWRMARDWGYRFPGAAVVLRKVVPISTAGSLADPLRSSFLRLARQEDTPPDYANLARRLAEFPPEWIQVMPGQSPARLFFAAVRYLGDAPLDWKTFLAWCQARRSCLQELLGRRRLQVNSVRRCAPLVAGLSWIQRRHPGQQLGVIEFGAAAGLLLNFPFYRLEYSESQVSGPLDSPLRIDCKTKGDFGLEPLHLGPLLGLDVQPLDLSREEDQRWLRAQSWGSKSLDLAIALAQKHPPSLSSEPLEGVLSRLPPGPKVVFHSHCANQLSAEQRRHLEQTCHRHQAYRLSLEWEDALAPLLRVRDPEGGCFLLGACPPGHLHWIDRVR